jgi:hypothetical protein
MQLTLLRKNLLLTNIFFWLLACSFAQPATALKDFISYQKSFRRVSDVYKLKEDTLRRQFAQKGITWPARYMYIRSFK